MSNVDASVAQEVARRCRLGMRLKIAGRTEDGRPEILGHADRHHVPFNELPEMNAGVEPRGDEVDSGFVGRHVEYDVGVIARELSQLRGEPVGAARGDTTKRTRPAGRSRSPETSSRASRTSPSAGRSRATSCAPASVGATLRVVRASKRTPKRSSSSRIAWLSAEGVTPRRLAARVKLRSSATARNADRTLSSSRTICELYSLTLVDYSRYCRAVPPVTIAPWTSNAPVRSPRARAQPTGSPGPCGSIRCFKPPIRRARPAPASRSSRALARRGIRIPWGRL